MGFHCLADPLPERFLDRFRWLAFFETAGDFVELLAVIRLFRCVFLFFVLSGFDTGDTLEISRPRFLLPHSGQTGFSSWASDTLRKKILTSLSHPEQ
jgi:hypothetical protein